jgi:hypothetical protein
MANLLEYFTKTAYKPKYVIGDRVFGRWNKIPFIGTVGNDTIISNTQGPQISILLDLPIAVKGQTHNILIVKHKDVKLLKSFENESKQKIK